MNMKKVLSLLILVCVTTLVNAGPGPIRFLRVHRTYPNNYMSQDCRYLHPFHYRSPQWYKRHQVKVHVNIPMRHQR
jgi:hypothetical protein